ncbi:hypothetical protein J6590_064708 [Homalodisca vitripennis]|nr:hypothetical protein J6590_064708 [Homalodisca vitripennis]
MCWNNAFSSIAFHRKPGDAIQRGKDLATSQRLATPSGNLANSDLTTLLIESPLCKHLSEFLRLQQLSHGVDTGLARDAFSRVAAPRLLRHRSTITVAGSAASVVVI